MTTSSAVETQTSRTIKRTDLSRFHLDILQTLAKQGQMYGMAIKRALEDEYEADGDDDVHVPHGRLYPNLDKLADAGLIEKSALNNRTNGYELTDAGSEFVNREAQSWVHAAESPGGDD